MTLAPLIALLIRVKYNSIIAAYTKGMRVEYFKGQERLRDWLHWKIGALVGVLETLVHSLVTERVTIGCCAGAAVRTKLEHNLAYHFDSALRRGSFTK